MRVNVTAKGKQIGKIYIFNLIPDTFCIIVNLKKKNSSPFFYSHFDLYSSNECCTNYHMVNGSCEGLKINTFLLYFKK